MNLFRILFTVVLFAILVVAIKKKWNLPIILLFSGVGAMIVMSLITGNSPVANSTGNVVLDAFQYVQEAAIAQLSNAGLIVMTVMGYAAFMDEIKASKLFAYKVSRPLLKIKNHFFLTIATFVLVYLFCVALPSGIGALALMLATIYPVLTILGLPSATCAAVFVAGTMIYYSPSQTLTALALQFAGMNISVPEFMIKYQTPFIPIVFVGLAIVVALSNNYWTKKDNSQPNSELVSNIEEEIKGVPGWYAFLPILPLAVILLTSGMIIKGISMGISAANFSSYVFVCLLLGVTRCKNILSKAYTFFVGMADVLKSAVALFIMCAVFSQGINMVGGIPVILGWLTNGGSTNIFFVIIVSCLIAVLSALATGNVIVGFSVLPPIIAQLCGGDTHTMLAFEAILLGYTGTSILLSPTAALVMLTSEKTNTPVGEIIKRNAIPFAFSLVWIGLVGYFCFFA